MGALRLFAVLIVAAFAWLVLSVGIFSMPAFAQDDTQQLINNGLCSGANLELNGNGDCSTTDNGVDKFNRIVRKLINTLSWIVGVVAVVMIIVGGLRYVTSGGSDSSVTSAKNTILYAIIGLVIVALSQVLVHFILKQVT